MRTDAEKQAFAMKCLEIEKEGGDVLGYIEVNWPSYSPRATWYNLQRQYLNRNMNTFTEGRPKEKPIPKRKEEDEMRKTTRGSQAEPAEKVVKCWKAGGDVRQLLTDLGFTNTVSALRNTKAWVRKNRPEWTEIIDKVRIVGPYGIKNKWGEDELQKARQKPAETWGEPDEAPETVKFEGKEYEKMDSPSPTCCQPARPSGVEVPDELPPVDRFVVEDKAGNKCTYTDEVDAWDPDTLQKYKIYPVGSHERIEFKPTRVQSLLGTWQNNVKDQTFTFAPNEPNGGFISMPITDWLNLAAEIPEAIKALSK